MKDWRYKVLAVAIAVIFVIFVNLAIDTLYPGPDLERFKDSAEETGWGVYQRNVFVINVVVGTLALVCGWLAVPSRAEAVGSGLMLGGIITLLIGVVRYWSEMGKVLNLGVTGLALGVLVWVGLTKLAGVEVEG